MKKAAEWFYSTVFREESIRPRNEQPRERLPAALQAARSLESGPGARDSRSALFLKQAKLLEFYSDDYPFDKNVTCYYPTYQALSDQELRGYFSWRTKLRAGKPAENLPVLRVSLYLRASQPDRRDGPSGRL